MWPENVSSSARGCSDPSSPLVPQRALVNFVWILYSFPRVAWGGPMACCNAAGKNDSSNALIWEEQFEIWKNMFGDNLAQWAKSCWVWTSHLPASDVSIYALSRCSARLVHNAQDFWRLWKEDKRGVHPWKSSLKDDFVILESITKALALQSGPCQCGFGWERRCYI